MQLKINGNIYTTVASTDVAVVTECGLVMFKGVVETYVNKLGKKIRESSMGFESMTFRTPGGCSTYAATRTLKGNRPLTGFL